MVHIGFTESYYDSLTGAQKSMLLLLTQSGVAEKTLLTPHTGDLTEYAKKEGINTNTIEYPKRLDKFDKKLINESFPKQAFTGAVLLRYHCRLINQYRKEEYDIIYCNGTRSLMLFGPPAKVLGIPVISYVGNNEPLGIFDKIRLRMADRVMCNTEGVKSRFTDEDLKKFKYKFIINNTGVDTDEFNPIENNYRTNDEPLEITQVATIQERKGQDVLVNAISKIDSEIGSYNINFAGDAPEGATEYKDKIIQQAKNKKIIDSITFLGWVDNIRELLEKTDIFVLPSRNEGLPRSLLEAGAMGVPLISTAAGGAEDIVIDSQTGYIVEFNNPNQLANKIRILAEDIDKRQEFGQNARNHILTNFSIDSYVETFEKVVSDVMSD